MLYLTTRNKVDSFTAYRVLHSEAAPDGGQFMPMRIPVLTDYQLAEFQQLNFGGAVAKIINLYFGTELTGWDVDFAVGRQCLTLNSIGHRVSVAEAWHNPAGSKEYLVRHLLALSCGEKCTDRSPNSWFRTVVDIALLFGIYGKYYRREVHSFDVALDRGDLRELFAVRCAQKMGLPVDKVILATAEGDGIWSLFSFGDYQTTGKKILPGLESLLWMEFGYREVFSYLQAVRDKRTYRLHPVALDKLRRGIFPAVVGKRQTVQTSAYPMDISLASAFGALQDYRAKAGENSNTLLFAISAEGQ